jgi:hypothetical protein
MFNFTDKDQFRRIFSLAVMFFSAVGFHILQFSASLLVWMAIIFVINYKNIFKIPTYAWIRTGLLIIAFVLVFIFKGAEFPYFVVVAIITALFGLSNYFNNKNLFFSDFSKLLQFYMYYALISIPILLFGRSLFNEIMLGYSRYLTFFGLFWFNDNGGPSFFGGLRPCGFTWEVGIWQLFLNLNFLFALYENRSTKKILLSVFSAIFVFSTTGIILTCFIYLLYFFVINKKTNKLKMLIPIVFIMVSYPILIQNIDDKINGEFSGSGMTRVADIFIGITILSDYPLFGAEQESAKASSNSTLYNVKEKFWSGNYTDGGFDSFMDVPNSNGIVIFLLDWGLPLGIFLLFRSIRSNLFIDQKLSIVLMLTIYFSIFSEAISRTSFFYFFILAAFLIKSKRKYEFG